MLANDHIIGINGEDLSQISDAAAFGVMREALHRASQQETIEITVARERRQQTSQSPVLGRNSEIAIDVKPSKARKPFAIEEKPKPDHG